MKFRIPLLFSLVILMGILSHFFPYTSSNLTWSKNLAIATSVKQSLFWKSAEQITISTKNKQFKITSLYVGNNYNLLSEEAIETNFGYAWLWADRNSPKVCWLELDTSNNNLYLNLRHRQILNWDVHLGKKALKSTPIFIDILKDINAPIRIKASYPASDTTSGRLLLMQLN